MEEKQVQQPTKKKSFLNKKINQNQVAIILGILGILSHSIVLGVIGLVCGIYGLKLSKKNATWGIVLSAIAIVSGIGSYGLNNTNRPSSNSVANTVITPIDSTCSDLDSIKSNAQKIDFAQLDKDPSNFTGKDAKFTGQIAQIQELNGQGMIRLSVTNLGYGIWSSSDIVYITYTGHNDFVQDDVVTVYGVLQGSYTYTSEANFQITVPSMIACSVEKPTVKKVTPVSTVDLTPSTTNSTNTNSVNPTPVVQTLTPPVQQVPKTWHTAFTFSNSGVTQSPPFSMQGSEWRITYTCTPTDTNQGNLDDFTGEIDSASTGMMANMFANGAKCPSTNTSYVYAQTPDQYYLSFNPFYTSYTVTVEDYY